MYGNFFKFYRAVDSMTDKYQKGSKRLKSYDSEERSKLIEISDFSEYTV